MLIKYDLILKVKREILNQKWRKLNNHNFTTVNSIFPIDRVKVGKGTYGSLDIELYGNSEAKVSIGHYCSIARDVRFIADGGHDISNTFLYPFRVRYLGETDEATTKGPIIVEDDVWIGERSLILSGIRIGQGAVVAAGSVVTKDVAAYTVVGGNPARVIKTRFENNIIQHLLKFDFNKLEKSELVQFRNELYKKPFEFINGELYRTHTKTKDSE